VASVCRSWFFGIILGRALPARDRRGDDTRDGPQCGQLHARSYQERDIANDVVRPRAIFALSTSTQRPLPVRTRLKSEHFTIAVATAIRKIKNNCADFEERMALPRTIPRRAR